ncbi:hypothetical protein Ate02nite_65610 [Paractinoplanes tereljensis]|uniref:Uncharacterized protein n=1 Tax=Paractinoplanes tereljensis TaxID=571912 RepID=A0A919NTP9_9ACTN|nr:hypothetical protein [Actinoplanes tereljensis]GIF23831.1 hypothetical protein Ate02nite_65610 [Actinoplanes tereljensis]
MRRSLDTAGALTWFFLTLAVVALFGSIMAAAATLLSLHGRHIREDFAQLDGHAVVPDRRRSVAARARMTGDSRNCLH